MCSSGKSHLSRQQSLLLYLGRRQMRVKLCTRCPYTPRDLAAHYDPKAELHVCAKCDGRREASPSHYPRKTHRRKKCTTVLNISGTAQPSVARSVREGLVSLDTTPVKPPSVQGNALTASGSVERVTANGYVDFRPPETDCGEILPAIFRNPGFHLCVPPPDAVHSSDTVFCFALGGAT